MNLKKNLLTGAVLAATAITCTCLPGVSQASYQLNEQVKDATPALKEAATIGARVNHNPALKNEANKDAIVVMSFGTTFKDTRAKTIDAVVNKIKAQNPDKKVVTAFTSHIIIDRIQAKEGIKYPTPEEAMQNLKKDGYTRVAMTSLDMIPGMEYNYDVAVYNQYKNDFKTVSLGTPLMFWMGQENQSDQVADAMKAFSTQFPKLDKHSAVLIMAHGTPDPGNAYYAVMQDRLDSMKLGNAYIYTVEGWPSLETVMPELKAKGVKNVTLMPFMMVAGDHANNDMAGADKDSHKSQLEAAGFKVTTYIHGAGENPAIQDLFAARAKEAVAELDQ